MAGNFKLQVETRGTIDITTEPDNELLIIVNEDPNGVVFDRKAIEQIRDYLSEWLERSK